MSHTPSSPLDPNADPALGAQAAGARPDHRERLIVAWLLLALAAVILYKGFATPSGLGRIYVKPDRVAEDGTVLTYTEVPSTVVQGVRQRPADPQVMLSPFRTIGLWVAAVLTLCTFSYLYRDNPFYKLSEALIVGVSAGYWFVAGFWDAIVDKLLAKLMPQLMRAWALPSLSAEATTQWIYVVPFVLGVLLFARFIPRQGWLSQWPLAFIVGTFAGLRLISYLDADFVSQIRSTILPLVVIGPQGFDPWLSLRNSGLVVCTLACLTYFLFSIEHKGWLGRFASLGIGVLMVTFGASFAFTVMGRITLLTRRFEFLLQDWLWMR
jgi:hypothetical protein